MDECSSYLYFVFFFISSSSKPRLYVVCLCFLFFLVPQKGKMNQIGLCNWLPVRETWGCLVRSKLLVSTYRDLLITPLHVVRVLYVSCIMDRDGGRRSERTLKKKSNLHYHPE